MVENTAGMFSHFEAKHMKYNGNLAWMAEWESAKQVFELI